MAFGGGLRSCVGADFSKLQMSIFLHFLVTRNRYYFRPCGFVIDSIMRCKFHTSFSCRLITFIFFFEYNLYVHFCVLFSGGKHLEVAAIVRTPGLEFPDGYHIQIRQRD
jgi:hypothetical protein